jgi:hypothetical protein
MTWTRKRLAGITANKLYLLTADGRDGAVHPDFTATGAPIEFGFFRANSNGPGGHSYRIVGAIDNWRVQVNPACTTPADCDDGDACTADTCPAGACVHGEGCYDGDPCTTDACDAGTCTYPPFDCDDGKACTADSCGTDGTCVHTVAATFEVVEAEVTTLIAVLDGPACGAQPLAKKVARNLKAKLAKVRARVASADAATKVAAITRRLGKGDKLLTAARAALDTAVGRGLVTSACRDDLAAFLGEIHDCLAALPRS